MIEKRGEVVVVRELLRGRISSEIEKILFDNLYDDLYKESIRVMQSSMETADGTGYIISTYKKYYAKAGIDFPKIFEDVKTSYDFSKLKKHLISDGE